MANIPEIFKEFMPDKLKSLPKEERRAKLKEFLQKAKENNDINVVLFDETHGRNINLLAMAEELGEDKAVELLDRILEASNTAEGITIDTEKIKETMTRVRNGSATDEDLKILKLISSSSKVAEESKGFLGAYLEIFAAFIFMARDKMHYDVKAVDLIGGLNLLMYTNFTSMEEYKDSRLGLYKDNIDAALSVIGEVAESIDETFKKSLQEELSPELYVAGLLELACRVAAENQLPFGDIDKIAKVLDIDGFEQTAAVTNKVFSQAEEDVRNDINKQAGERLDKELESILSQEKTPIKPSIVTPNIVPNIISPEENQNKKDRLKDL